MTPRRPCTAMTIALMTLPVLAGCDSEAGPAPLSDSSLADLCDRPEQLLVDVWQFAEPVVGEPNNPEADPTEKIGLGGQCTLRSNGSRVATSALITATPGFLDPPRDADAVQIGDHVVKTWSINSARLTFRTVIGGWAGSITVTPGTDRATNEPAATYSQIHDTADELVKIVSEFKGPDFTPKQY